MGFINQFITRGHHLVPLDGLFLLWMEEILHHLGWLKHVETL